MCPRNKQKGVLQGVRLYRRLVPMTDGTWKWCLQQVIRSLRQTLMNVVSSLMKDPKDLLASLAM